MKDKVWDELLHILSLKSITKCRNSKIAYGKIRERLIQGGFTSVATSRFTTYYLIGMEVMKGNTVFDILMFYNEEEKRWKWSEISTEEK